VGIFIVPTSFRGDNQINYIIIIAHSKMIKNDNIHTSKKKSNLVLGTGRSYQPVFFLNSLILFQMMQPSTRRARGWETGTKP